MSSQLVEDDIFPLTNSTTDGIGLPLFSFRLEIIFFESTIMSDFPSVYYFCFLNFFGAKGKGNINRTEIAMLEFH